MIGSLLYLTASRPDIMFSVYMCARFQANPKETHLIAVKESLDILSTHQALFFGIPKELYLNQLAIPIRIMPVAKLNSVALSTAKAEYIAAGACCAQILYMKQTLLDYGVVLEKVPLLCGNESVTP